jgi:hypothetical protein
MNPYYVRTAHYGAVARCVAAQPSSAAVAVGARARELHGSAVRAMRATAGGVRQWGAVPTVAVTWPSPRKKVAR